ncbi:receptor-like protein EIX1 isoform X6 [Arachis stenosperma]|uniref:receptor-like protein EIX1 isoform X6 n=1 Tax=Arachis stenosperma TaxID=217475 RepID=UPI0025AC16A1|nr:receptor-like protein EIX1 isoform X6 [Arachis stenosperma]
MNPRFAMAIHYYVFIVFFMHISVLHVLALNPMIGNVTVKCIESERQALLALKQGFHLNNNAWLSSWGHGDNQKECCNWEHIQCSNETGHVLKLDLHVSDHIVRAGSITTALAELHHLNYLDLSYISFNLTPSIPIFIASLTHLRYLNLSHSGFQGKVPHQFGNLLFLEYLDLGYNSLLAEIPPQISNLSNLVYLHLGSNSFHGNIPPQLGSLLPLKYLDLSENGFNGTIPENFGNLSNLEYLDLSSSYQISLSSDLQWLSHLSFMRHLSLPKVNLSTANNWQQLVSGLSHLQYLDFNGCDLSDSIPSSLSSAANFSTSLSFVDLSSNNLMNSSLIFPWLMNSTSSLAMLNLDHNYLRGTIPQAIGELSSLEYLNLASNQLEGQIPISLFHVCSLRELDLSGNRLSGQFHEFAKALSNCNHKQLQTLKMGWNEITGIGQLSNLRELRLGNNSLEGPVPAFLSISAQVFLSNNMFSTANLFLCSNVSANTEYLDLSNNHIRGQLPDCWMNFQSLGFLDLSNNYFHGSLPRSMGSLRQIQSLHLGDNNFSGEIPLSFVNCTELRLFDAAKNNLTGPFPSWIGNNLSNLFILSLHSNQFHGSMPLNICNLDELHLLDLSLNSLSGNIPKCISNLSAMASQATSKVDIFYAYDAYYDDFDGITSFGVNADSASLIWKGKMSKYRSTLGLLRSIDLSSNIFNGEIPSEMMSLVGLVSLNISRNKLVGNIPQGIGQLKSLDFLDLSRNQLSGRIPSQLSQLDRLSVLDLSYNDLSGQIPLGTQLQTRDASAYIGNPKLCGAPLNKTCLIPTQNPVDGNDDHEEQFFTEGFYIALAIGFIMGFWGVSCSLILKKSWRYAYFKFFNDLYDKLYVFAAIKMAKLKRLRA